MVARTECWFCIGFEAQFSQEYHELSLRMKVSDRSDPTKLWSWWDGHVIRNMILSSSFFLSGISDSICIPIPFPTGISFFLEMWYREFQFCFSLRCYIKEPVRFTWTRTIPLHNFGRNQPSRRIWTQFFRTSSRRRSSLHFAFCLLNSLGTPEMPAASPAA